MPEDKFTELLSEAALSEDKQEQERLLNEALKLEMARLQAEEMRSQKAAVPKKLFAQI